MADIDEKRIVSISDGDQSIPIYWGIEAKDIKYNNAIVMATVIARRIDKQNLWDGLLHFKERVKSFTIRSPHKINLIDINDELTFKVQNPINISFTENIEPFSVNVRIKNNLLTLKDTLSEPTSPRLPLTSTALYSTNISDTSIYIEFRNPVNLGTGTLDENVGAFQVLVTVGTTTYYPNITSISLDSSVSGVVLNLDSDIMKDSTQVITVIYDADIGTFESNASGNKMTGFQTSFNYVSNDE